MVPFDWVVQLCDTETHGPLSHADEKSFRNI